MELCKDTEEILEFLDYSSGASLRKRDDLGAILELGAAFDEPELVADIIFHGAALWKLYKTIATSEPNAEGIEKLITETKETESILVDSLKALIGDEDRRTSERFEKIYFQGDTGCSRNLIDLSKDLSELKSVQIQMKNRPED